MHLRQEDTVFDDGEVITCLSDGRFSYFLHEDMSVILWDKTRQYYMRNPENYLVLHRDDGPAIEMASGETRWYFRGNLYSFDEWLDLLPKTDEEKVMLKLIYG